MLVRLVNLFDRTILPVRLHLQEGIISQIEPVSEVPDGTPFALPGFVDAHVHIESSMLPPTEFARMALVHGTVATVSDPHEIANVLGMEGVQYMLDNARHSPLKFCFGAPSCVPSTPFETAGAVLTAQEVGILLQDPSIGYLSEVMNFPGVLKKDPELMAMIAAAQAVNKPVDGHAPGLTGADAAIYFAAGISTDHECFTLEEGREKAQLGVQLLIREGSAARNFEALWPLLQEFPNQVHFCSDDKHPDELLRGHINELARRAIEKGCDLFDVLRAACVNPVLHYRLPVGLLRKGDPADFILVEDLVQLTVLSTWINGEKVAEQGNCQLPFFAPACPNKFNALPLQPEDFEISAPISATIEEISTVFPVLKMGKQVAVRVIGARDGQLVTDPLIEHLPVTSYGLLPDTSKDLLFITVVNRYDPESSPAMAFVRGFGLREGAIASSVAHDSHNIVAVGTDAASLSRAVNAVIAAKGGVSATNKSGEVRILELPIAGLMSPMEGPALAKSYQDLDSWVKTELGSSLQAPFMTLSFLALPVIPSLKITDWGLFDVDTFGFTSVYV
jgi:adenine deaminase